MNYSHLTFLFRTTERDDQTIYLNEKTNQFFCKRYGLELYEIEENYAMSIAWFHINRTTGFPVKWDDEKHINVITISKEAQDLRCKLTLKLIKFEPVSL